MTMTIILGFNSKMMLMEFELRLMSDIILKFMSYCIILGYTMS